MLDEVIDHLKQLQAQVQMMRRMSSMMMPMAMPQLQMSVMANMAQMAQMAQMGLGMMNMAGPLAQPAFPGLAPAMMHQPTPFVPMQPWNAAGDRQKQPAAAAVPDVYSAFLACQAAQQNAQVRTYRTSNQSALFTRIPLVDSYAMVRISVAAASAASPTERHGGVQQDDGHVPEAKPAAGPVRHL
jgi:hypothetical protein